MGRSVCFIRIFAYKMHTDGFRCFYGRYIGVFAAGIQGRIICVSECSVADGLCRLTGIALSLTVAADMVGQVLQFVCVTLSLQVNPRFCRMAGAMHIIPPFFQREQKGQFPPFTGHRSGGAFFVPETVKLQKPAVMRE